jgi:hypothetical protein
MITHAKTARKLAGSLRSPGSPKRILVSRFLEWKVSTTINAAPVPCLHAANTKHVSQPATILPQMQAHASNYLRTANEGITSASGLSRSINSALSPYYRSGWTDCAAVSQSTICPSSALLRQRIELKQDRETGSYNSDLGGLAPATPRH